jgi:hypothetical protein
MNSQMKRLSLFMVILGMLFSGVALGQNTGTIKVVVTDENGTPVEGATVFAESTESISNRTSKTRANGEARLVALAPANNYVVTATKEEYQTVKNEGIVVKSGEQFILRMTMQSKFEEEMTVISSAPVLDVTKSLASTTITLELTEALPTGRSYQSYLQLVPGVLPDDFAIGDTGNPASRSGLNYSDIGGDVGVSTDNFFYRGHQCDGPGSRYFRCQSQYRNHPGTEDSVGWDSGRVHRSRRLGYQSGHEIRW